jgi:hypothetical protein
MRLLTSHKVNGLNEAIEIRVMDEPGAGGANHEYHFMMRGKNGAILAQGIHFQEGPIAETDVNGISIEALLAVCQDRLEGFQSGEFRNRENALALTHIQEAMHWLHHRTRDRIARGVEGTLQK